MAVKRSTGGVLAAVVLATLVLLVAALVPIVECPRRGIPPGESTLHRLREELARVEHDVAGCTFCSDRGKVTLLRRLLWRPPPP